MSQERTIHRQSEAIILMFILRTLLEINCEVDPVFLDTGLGDNQ
jgi:hypothetical protein